MALLPFLHDDDLLGRHHRSWSVPDDDWPLMITGQSNGHLRDLRNPLAEFDRDTTITMDKDHFQANIDVQHFRPEEISVKFTGDNTVTVEAKHEEKHDGHGFISRHFSRRYLLPQDCNVRKLQSHLSADGVLSITAPFLKEGEDIEAEEIPIIHTRRPIIKRPHLWPSHHVEDRKRKLSH